MAVAVAPGAAQIADALFDDAVLHEVRLYIHPDDWAELRRTFQENTYYPADFEWRGQVVSQVGVRSRGGGSRSGVKPGLKIDFDRYAAGQEFLGLTGVVLDNVGQDATYMKDPLTMALFRRLGFAAPRESFTRLYVNGEYSGLYVLVEDIDAGFIARALNDPGNGFLYEYHWYEDYRFQWLGPDSSSYIPAKWEARTREEDPEPDTLRNMIQAINEAPDSEFVARVSDFVDLRGFMRYLALENYVAEWDGILGTEGLNNFYLYRPQGSRRFTFIPWDKDVTFSFVDHDPYFNLMSNILSRRAVEHGFLPQYTEALRAAAEAAGGAGGYLDEIFARYFSLIRDAALEDPYKPTTNEGFLAAAEAVQAFIRERREFVLGRLDQ
jgi:spore coat protein CotH